jgi:L-ascorbate metabolism protein UlaG (beta-lactamase superfamily)
MALWGGLSVLSAEDHFFFAGDTGYAQHFTEVRERLGAPRLALLPIGAYEPRAVMQSMHMNPTDAVQAHQDLKATQSLAIHHRTFQLTDEAMNQPLLDLANALNRAHLPAQSFATPTEGEMVVA